MTKCSFLFLLVMSAFLPMSAQERLWLRSEQGSAVVLDPATGGWLPVGERTETVRRTYLLTKERSAVNVFAATEVHPIGAEWYIFLEDVIPKDRSQLVSELTRIEAEQLPGLEWEGDSTGRPEVGLTYGRQRPAVDAGKSVPYMKQRLNCVNGSMDMGRYDAAVLTMKRMMSRYPSLYFDRPMVERLFGLYERLGLDGFLFDESSRLLALSRNADQIRLLKQWNTGAKERLKKQ